MARKKTFAERITVRLEPGKLAEIDEARKDQPRQEFIRRVLDEHLRGGAEANGE